MLRKTATLTSLIALLLTTHSQAAQIYNENGASVNFYGRMEFNVNNSGENTEGEGTGRLGVSASSVIIPNYINAIAQGEWDVNGENSDENSFDVRHLYAGFDYNRFGILIFGQTDSAFYQSIAATDIYNSYGMAAFQHVDEGRQEKQVIYSNSINGLYVGASYQMSNEDFTDSYTELTTHLNHAVASTIGYNFAGGFSMYAGFRLEEFESLANKKNYAASIYYTNNPFYIGVALAGSRQNETGSYHGVDIATSYTFFNFAKVYGGYSWQENTDNEEDTINLSTAGIELAYNKNMKTWFEYQANLLEDDNLDASDNQWTIAMQYNF